MNAFRKFTAISMLIVGFILMTSLMNQKGFYWSSLFQYGAKQVESLQQGLLTNNDISNLTEQWKLFENNIVYGDSLGIASDFIITKMSGNNYSVSIKLHTIPNSNNLYEFMIEEDFIQKSIPNEPRLTAWVTPVIMLLQLPNNELAIENIKPRIIPWDNPMALEIVRYNDTKEGIRSVKILTLTPCTDTCDFEFNDNSKYKYDSTLIKCE